jgi:hypothetical protein
MAMSSPSLPSTTDPKNNSSAALDLPPLLRSGLSHHTGPTSPRGSLRLTKQIGHGVAQWPPVILKELVDNALDAPEEASIAPAIQVEVVETAAA